ncbi:MAG TPA: hypothetical protein VK194_09510, partial [Candidatus Deferrimicrobium sp.]|nr:hypothetical protein [Candidatus Deferrimicrobium sp.]
GPVSAGGGWLAVAPIAVVGAIPFVASRLAPTLPSAGRERAWQVEAIGLAVLAALWLAVVVGSAGRAG